MMRMSAGPKRNSRSRAMIGTLLLASSLAAWASPGTAQAQAQAQAQTQTQAQAQAAWRGLNVPRYPNATDYDVKVDDDERDIYFRSQDNVQTVFDFYRGYLEREGFRVTESKTTKHGFKADMVRGQGGPGNAVELDAKLKDGRYKVEIEFDD